MTKKLDGSAVSGAKPPTYKPGTTSQKKVVLAASPSLEGGDDWKAQNRSRRKVGRYKTDKTRWRFCSHPRTPENSVPSGRGHSTCKLCKQERDRIRYHHPPEGKVKGRRRRLPTHRRVPSIVLESWRPLPVFNTSGRSYLLAPLREKQGA